MARSDGSTVRNAIDKLRSKNCLALADKLAEVTQQFRQQVSDNPGDAVDLVNQCEEQVKSALMTAFDVGAKGAVMTGEA